MAIFKWFVCAFAMNYITEKISSDETLLISKELVDIDL